MEKPASRRIPRTASWCRSVARPGVVRDSISPVAQGCRASTFRTEMARCRMAVRQSVSPDGRSISAKTPSIMASVRSPLLDTWLYSDIASTPSSPPSLRMLSDSIPLASANAMADPTTLSRFNRARASLPGLIIGAPVRFVLTYEHYQRRTYNISLRCRAAVWSGSTPQRKRGTLAHIPGLQGSRHFEYQSPQSLSGSAAQETRLMVMHVDKAGGDHPVVLTAHLDPGLSRWQWLVKWFLAIPHYFLLAFLWAAFLVVTVIAGFCILFTGRYPRPLFDFTSGVLRWSWRVSYYASNGGIGTDQYPPFTLGLAPGYPAFLDIANPATLSRGLVLV